MTALGWSSASRAHRLGLLAAIATGALVRIAYLAAKWDHPLLLNDSLWYSAQAVVLARGDGFEDPFYGGPSAEHGPLTPIVLAAVSWLDDPLPWQRAVMTLVGIVTVLGVAALARRVAGWTAAVAAAWIAALYPNLWMNDALVMSESLAALLVVVVVWLALDVVAGEGSPVWRPLACGTVIGLAALTRSELGLLAPILAIVVWRTRRRSAWLVVAATAATLVPWVVPNLVRFEQPVLLTTNDGTTLLGANCADSYAGPDIGGWSLFCVLDAGSPPGEDPATRSNRQRRVAVRYALDHAERLPLVAAARVGRALDVVGVRNLVDADVGEERDRWASWAGIVSWWALAVLAAIGLAGLDGSVRRVLLVPVLSVLVTTIVFYGGHRIRAPMEPIVAVAAGVAVAARVERARTPETVAR